jgi:hypothetical protein
MKVLLIILAILFFIGALIIIIYNQINKNQLRANKYKNILKQIKKIKSKIFGLEKSLEYLYGFDELKDIKEARQKMIEKLYKDIDDLLVLYFKRIFPKVLIIDKENKIKMILNEDKEIFKLISNKIFQSENIEIMSFEKFGIILNQAFKNLDEVGLSTYSRFKEKPIKIISLTNIDIIDKLSFDKYYLKEYSLKTLLDIYQLKKGE